jgi:hypothetical protein
MFHPSGCCHGSGGHSRVACGHRYRVMVVLVSSPSINQPSIKQIGLMTDPSALAIAATRLSSPQPVGNDNSSMDKRNRVAAADSKFLCKTLLQALTVMMRRLRSHADCQSEDDKSMAPQSWFATRAKSLTHPFNN